MYATLVTTQYYDAINADKENWPDEIKQFAKEEGLWPEEYKPGLVIPILGDAISTYMMFKVFNSSSIDLPIWERPINDIIAALVMLTSPFIALMTNYMLYPPPPFIPDDYVVARYYSKKWLENPDFPPLILNEYTLEIPYDSFLLFKIGKVHITLTNISNRIIKSFKIKRIYGFDSFGNAETWKMYPSFSESVVQNNIYLRPLEQKTFTWDIWYYMDDAVKIRLLFEKVLFADGTIWEAE